MFFRLKLWLTVVLFNVAGALLLLMGTPFLYERVMPVYDTLTSNVGTAVAGELMLQSQATIDAATRASADPGVRAALKKGELSPTVEATLLASADTRSNPNGDGRFSAPAFAVLVRADGRVSARVGKQTKLDDQLQGFPVVEEALGGYVRDSYYEMDGAPFHIVTAPVYEGTTPVGVVLQGWAYDAAFVDRIAKLSGVGVVLVTPTARVGTALPELDAETLRGLQQDAEFGNLDIQSPALKALSLPILLPSKARYAASTVPLYPGERSARMVAAVDRNPAFVTIAVAQGAVIGSTLALGIFLLLIIATTLRSISRPMAAIMDHLSQFQQGTVVGILPESALSGPFVRLGKQINMILQMMPTSSRPGSSNTGAHALIPVGVGSGPLGGSLSSSNGGSSGPSLMSPALANSVIDDDPGLKFDGIPGLGSTSAGPSIGASKPVGPITSPSSLLGNLKAGSSIPSTSGPVAAAPGPAIATPTLAKTATPPSTKAPASGLSGLFDDGPDPLAAFRVQAGPAAAKKEPPKEKEKEDALDHAAADPFLSSSSADGGATVMFEVPRELIQRSQTTGEGDVAPSTPRMAPAVVQTSRAQTQPPIAARPQTSGTSESTVIAQVPQELLSASAPKADVSPTEDAHYREVYDKFVQTRRDCGEDTSDLTLDRFITKLLKNRQQIMEKHKAKSVRFQVYVKDGKAALRALPVRD